MIIKIDELLRIEGAFSKLISGRFSPAKQYLEKDNIKKIKQELLDYYEAMKKLNVEPGQKLSNELIEQFDQIRNREVEIGPFTNFKAKDLVDFSETDASDTKLSINDILLMVEVGVLSE
jgi:DNA-directed RNA polymerase subunit F